jgi:hypothetical protein
MFAKVLTTIGTVKFNANSKRVKARCAGFPVIVVREEADGHGFYAFSRENGGIAKFTQKAKTPAKAYAKAVKAAWL